MVLADIIQKLEGIASSMSSIRTIGHNDVYDINTTPNLEYGVFYITQNTHTLNEDVCTYSLNLFYIDRMRADKSNQLRIQSEGIVLLTAIINQLRAMGGCSIADDISLIPFNQRFTDDCAGVYATVNITCPSNLGVCPIEI